MKNNLIKLIFSFLLVFLVLNINTNFFQINTSLAEVIVKKISMWYIKENKIEKELSQKWNEREGEIRKHITKMARYITEGIIDVIE